MVVYNWREFAQECAMVPVKWAGYGAFAGLMMLGICADYITIARMFRKSL